MFPADFFNPNKYAPPQETCVQIAPVKQPKSYAVTQVAIIGLGVILGGVLAAGSAFLITATLPVAIPLILIGGVLGGGAAATVIALAKKVSASSKQVNEIKTEASNAPQLPDSHSVANPVIVEPEVLEKSDHQSSSDSEDSDEVPPTGIRQNSFQEPSEEVSSSDESSELSNEKSEPVENSEPIEIPTQSVKESRAEICNLIIEMSQLKSHDSKTFPIVHASESINNLKHLGNKEKENVKNKIFNKLITEELCNSICLLYTSDAADD